MVLKRAKLAAIWLCVSLIWGTSCGQKNKTSDPGKEGSERQQGVTSGPNSITSPDLQNSESQRILHQLTDNIVISNRIVDESSCSTQANIVTFWTDRNENKAFDENIDSDRNEVTLCPEDLEANVNSGGEIQMSQNPGHNLKFEFQNVSNTICEFGGIQVEFKLSGAKFESKEEEQLGRVTFTLCNQQIETVVVKDGKDGVNGKDGKDGKDGKNGLNGKDGKDGENGLNGKDGVDGKDGIDGENYVNEFVASYASENESFEFDLNRYKHIVNMPNAESVIIYGQFSFHKTGVQNILLFEPEFHECLAEDQAPTLISHESFISSLNELYQDKRASYSSQLRDVATELDNAKSLEQSLASKLEQTQQQKDQESTLLTTLGSNHDDLLNQISATEVFIAQAKQTADGLRTQLNQIQNDNGKVSASVQEQKSKIQQQKAQIDELNQQKQSLTTDIGNYSSNLEKTKVSLNGKIQQLAKIKTDTKKTQEEVADLERQLKRANIFTYDSIKQTLEVKKSALIRMLVEKDQVDDPGEPNLGSESKPEPGSELSIQGSGTAIHGPELPMGLEVRENHRLKAS